MVFQRSFIVLLMLLGLGFIDTGLYAQKDSTFLGLKGKELRYKGQVVGVIDTVIVQVFFNNGFNPSPHYLFYVEVPDSIPLRKVRAALHSLLPFSSSWSILKGQYETLKLKNETSKKRTAGRYLKSAGTKRLIGVVVGLAGVGISVGTFAIKEPMVAAVTGGISGLILLILELLSAADLIRAGQELEKVNPTP
jgi:hypothetical protein